MEIQDAINSIVDINHYLRIKSDKLPAYTDSFLTNIRYLDQKLNNSERASLLKDKLNFERLFDRDNEKKYIQSACEVTVISYLAKKCPDTFLYEPKLRLPDSQKNVECQIMFNDYTYNIEVKCPSYDRIENQELHNRIRANVPVRTDINFVNGMVDMLNRHLEPQTNLRYEVPFRMDNTLKDFLKLSNQKFPTTDDSKKANILFICCSDESSIQDFLNYLFLGNGFFSSQPDEAILPVNEYENVDAVVLCNLYHRHHKYYNKLNIDNHWDLTHSFNLIFENKNRKYFDEKIDAIFNFAYNILPNYTDYFIEFIETDRYWPDIPERFVRELFSVERYTRELKNNGYDLF